MIVIDKGTGTVRLATAAEEVTAAALAKAAEQVTDQPVDKKTVHAKAVATFNKAKQAYAEAEVSHYGKIHQDKVDPDDLAKSRENVDACYSSYMDAKKAAVKAEADMYDDDKKGAMAKAAAEAEAKAAASDPNFAKKMQEEREAKEKADGEAKAKAEAEAKAAAEGEAKAKADGEAKAKAEGEAKAKAEAEAKAAADGEAKAKAEAEAKAKAEADGKAEATAIATKLATAEAEVERLKAELAKGSGSPAHAATGGGSKDAIARATVGFDQKAAADGKDGRKIVVLGGKAPTGGNIAVAAAAQGAMDLTGLFRRQR